jgi:hypothetical protein
VRHIIISAWLRKKCRDGEKRSNERKMKNIGENTAKGDENVMQLENKHTDNKKNENELGEKSKKNITIFECLSG